MADAPAFTAETWFPSKAFSQNRQTFPTKINTYSLLCMQFQLVEVNQAMFTITILHYQSSFSCDVYILHSHCTFTVKLKII